MLLQPFLGALIVLHRFAWAMIPALAAVVLVFLVREPWIVLARQRWVWRDARPETAEAKRYLAVELPLLGVAGGLLLVVWPWWIVAALGFSAALLTALAVATTVRNRRRAIWFQALSAAGLASSALAACLGVSGAVPAWGWWFWGLHAAHFLAAIVVVHARLEGRIAVRKAGPAATEMFHKQRRAAAAVQLTWAAASAVVFWTGQPLYGIAAALSAGVHLTQLSAMTPSRAAATSMNTVGLRALGLSIVFTLLVIAGSVIAGSRGRLL